MLSVSYRYINNHPLSIDIITDTHLKTLILEIRPAMFVNDTGLKTEFVLLPGPVSASAGTNV